MTSPLREVVADALPELPKAKQLANPYAHNMGSVTAYGYTADQMREYARAAIAATQPAASPGVEERARELLRAEEEAWDGSGDMGLRPSRAIALRAVCAALRTQPKTGGDVGRIDSPWRAHGAAIDTKALATAQEIALMWGKDRSQFVSRIQVAVTDAMRWAMGGSANPAPPTQQEARAADVLCVRCGRPTMHVGNVCFFCSKADKAARSDNTSKQAAGEAVAWKMAYPLSMPTIVMIRAPEFVGSLARAEQLRDACLRDFGAPATYTPLYYTPPRHPADEGIDSALDLLREADKLFTEYVLTIQHCHKDKHRVGPWINAVRDLIGKAGTP